KDEAERQGSARPLDNLAPQVREGVARDAVPDDTCDGEQQRERENQLREKPQLVAGLGADHRRPKTAGMARQASSHPRNPRAGARAVVSARNSRAIVRPDHRDYTGGTPRKHLTEALATVIQRPLAASPRRLAAL